MDGVALASVITSGVLRITTSSIAVWSARQSAKLARETRTQQRLAESYLEVLRIVECEGQWIEASITNFMLAVADQDDNFPYRVADFQWVEMPPEPAATDRATIAAHLAFGSPNVRGLYEDWRSTLTKIDIEEDGIRRVFDDISGKGPSLDALKELEVLQPKERDARQAMADAIAEELGHR